jgi:NADP-dependent 3-hydroxy acid dehydrogenase YdfG
MSHSAGRNVLVTGASSGIGAATARFLAGENCRVVLMARRKPELEALAAEIRSFGGEAIVEAVDGGDGAAVLAMASRLRAAGFSPDVIIHAAGAGAWKYIEETTPAEALHMMSAPYFSAFHVTHAFMPGMLERRRGLIVTVNSPAARLPWPGCTGYAAARWALRGLHEALKQDLAGTGVRSIEVIFGEVPTPYRDVNANVRERLPTMSKIIPVLTPEDCARRIASLLSRPRSQTAYPFLICFFLAVAWIWPSAVSWLLRATGHRRCSTPARLPLTRSSNVKDA